MINNEQLITTSLDSEIVNELFPEFLKELSLESDKLLESFNLNDLVKVKEIAHKIIGVTQTFGAHHVKRNANNIIVIIDKNNGISLIEEIEDLRIGIRELKKVNDE
ncbi:MAG: hypothetical protein JKY48_06305 [Flavobacteriales bacterium]|nr:hypothetical protein [Flavobacteriales bacterium]